MMIQYTFGIKIFVPFSIVLRLPFHFPRTAYQRVSNNEILTSPFL